LATRDVRDPYRHRVAKRLFPRSRQRWDSTFPPRTFEVIRGRTPTSRESLAPYASRIVNQCERIAQESSSLVQGRQGYGFPTREVLMRRRTVVVFLIVLLTALVMAGVAAGSCNPGRSAASGNWWDGWTTSPSGACLIGSSANILVYSPYVYASDVTAWVMLENPDTGRYGQVGWLQQTNGSRFSFVESSTVNGGFRQTYFASKAVGSAPEYKVTFSSDAFHYFIDGVNYYTHANTGFGGCTSSQSAEVTNSANQMPGGYNNHVPFTNAQVRRSDTGWVNANGTPFASITGYGYSKVSSSNLQIWDKACAS